MTYTAIPLEVSLLFRYLQQELGNGLQRLKELSLDGVKTSFYQFMKKPNVAVSGEINLSVEVKTQKGIKLR